MARVRHVDVSRAVNERKEEAPQTNASVTDACQPQGKDILPLARLPCEVLLHVISFLGRSDRMRVACVCRAWRDLIYSSHRLWRSKQLRLDCSRPSIHNKRAYFYAKRFGHHLRQLNIICDHPKNHACKFMAICFRKLLISLRNPTLTSFEVTELRLGYANPYVVSQISIILSQMLGNLTQLKTFQMTSAQWSPAEGYHVLNTVFKTCRESLQNLYIDGYYTMPWYSHRPYEMEQFTAGLTSLSRLVKLSVDYFSLTNDCVVALAHARRGHLKKLKLVACDINPSSPRIASISWSTLTKACPSMRVEFCIDGSVVSPALSVPAILDPVLPIYKLRLSIGKRFIFIDMPTLNMAAVLQYITSHFRRRLVRFEMDIDNQDDHLDTALIRLVRKCRNLISVKVLAYFSSPETDHTVQEMVKERRSRMSKTTGTAANATALNPISTSTLMGIPRSTDTVTSNPVTDRQDDDTSIAGLAVRSSRWVSRWWRDASQSRDEASTSH